MNRSEREDERPWSAVVVVSEVPPQGVDLELLADAATRRRLAAANGLVDLTFAQARLRLAHRGREGLRVTGELRARAVQTCVVSLEPFEVEIVEPVDVEFEPARAGAPARDERSSRRRATERAPAPEDEEGMEDLDAPDEIVGGRIDLGALAAEFLTLGVDPYPRKPGADFAEPAPPEPAASPFAALARLSDRGGEGGKS